MPATPRFLSDRSSNGSTDGFPVYRPRDNGIRGQGLIGTETADNAFGQDGDTASLSSLPPDLWSQQLSNWAWLASILTKMMLNRVVAFL